MNALLFAILALEQAPPCDCPQQAPPIVFVPVQPAVVVQAPGITVAIGRPRAAVLTASDGSAVVRVRRGLFRRPAYIAVAPAAYAAPARPQRADPPKASPQTFAPARQTQPAIRRRGG